MKKMCRKVVSLLLAAVMVLTMTAFASVVYAADEDNVEADPNFKMGVILVGDETEGYSAAHIAGVKEAAKELGLDDSQIIWKYKVPEDSSCYDAAIDLVGQGCSLVIGNSYGHQTYLVQAAQEYPDVTFVSMTGDFAAISGLENFKNAFTNIYESRYVSGVVAGLKLNEMIEAGEITEDQAKMGYVGAFPYAEVISGYTSFYLGAKSVCPAVTMEVKYTNSWASFDLEKECADALISDGCVLISQHADTTGAPTACEAAGVPCVGYNIDMTSVAPNTALTSASINWGVYYTYAVQCMLDGTEIDVDWCKGFAEGADKLTPLNEKTVAEGTEEKVKEVEDAIIDGSLHVFDTSTFTVDGKEVTTYEKDGTEYVSDGYFHESEFGSAPAFDLAIDGITSIVE